MRVRSAPSEDPRGAPVMATYDLRAKALILHPDDDVVIAKAPIPTGTVLDHDGDRLEVVCDVRPGHKIARRARGTGEAVRRYGQVIGFATQADRGGRSRPHAQPRRSATTSRATRSASTSRPVDYYPARPDALLRRVQARGRASRDAQLRGDHLDGELLGQRQPVHQGAASATSSATSRTSTASSRSPTSRAAARSSSARTTMALQRVLGRLRQASERRPPTSSSGSAAR